VAQKPPNQQGEENMKNGDLPAMPTIYADMATNGQREIYCDQTGVTKREQFAMAAMQGLLASGATYKGSTTNRHLLAADAVAHADALLVELGRENNHG